MGQVEIYLFLQCQQMSEGRFNWGTLYWGAHHRVHGNYRVDMSKSPFGITFERNWKKKLKLS